jgi:hypothetical protein
MNVPTDLQKLLGKKRHKYGAKSTPCRWGHKHPSIAEANHCFVLHSELNAGHITSLVYEYPFELIVNDKLICVHKPDFYYKRACRNASGTAFWWDSCVDEVKGFRTSDWIIKSKLFQALFPGIKYRVL